MRTSRIFRLGIRIFLMILASTMSLVSFLGGYSAVLILTNEDNIDVDVSVGGNLFNASDPFKLDVNFEINNQGYFDLEDLEVELELKMEYVLKNTTIGGPNLTTSVLLYEGDKDFGTIESGELFKGHISIEVDDLATAIDFTDILNKMDRTKRPDFVASELIISAKYSLGLISFKVKIEDFDLGDYEGDV